MLLDVKNLSIQFDTRRGVVTPVDRMSFHVKEGEALGIVGESGCGKSITSLALMGLIPPNGKVIADKMEFMGQDLLKMKENKRRQIRGKDMAMIFQDPMTALNPSFTVGFQIIEALKAHQNVKGTEAVNKAAALLDQVGIPDARRRLENYPHQMSGGMCQRAMIAMAIACKPKLLIADEPTTALDVTIQSQILELIKKLQQEYKMALILITHDLGVVSEVADRIMVMYAGQVVESGTATQVIKNPLHPYTNGLLASLPSTHADAEHRSKLPSIPGMVPDLLAKPKGCLLAPRCPRREDRCEQHEISEVMVGEQMVKCILEQKAAP